MATSLYTVCVPSTFSGLSLFGASVLSIEAAVVTNYTASVPAELRFTQPAIEVRNATFCNVTVSYTHPGQGDNIVVEAWLPIENPVWNGRLQAVGGSGWDAGRVFASYMAMAGAISDGYATSTTDAGLGPNPDLTRLALVSPGNVNWYTLNNFGSVALNEQALLTKSLIILFHSHPPLYSYFTGCSQGGRQALLLAQRYPTAYDGISAGAPVLYTSRAAPALFWPQQVMHLLGRYPRGCEIDALSAAAIKACDGLDGVADGIVGEVDACLGVFDPFKMVGQTVEGCEDGEGKGVVVSEAAAKVVNATWRGMVSAEGRWVWHGVGPGSDLVTVGSGPFAIPGVAATDCSSGTCVGVPSYIALPYMQQYLARGDPAVDVLNLTHAQFDDLVHLGRQLYRSAIDTDDPDLSRFQEAGGKMVSFHGLWDGQIASGATRQYYQEVEALVPDVHDFYRHYEVPGLGHCSGKVSGQPADLFDQLRAWVEQGIAPGHTPVNVTVIGGAVQQRILCPYPQVARFDPAGCHDHADASCWACSAAPSRVRKSLGLVSWFRRYID